MWGRERRWEKVVDEVSMGIEDFQRWEWDPVQSPTHIACNLGRDKALVRPICPNKYSSR